MAQRACETLDDLCRHGGTIVARCRCGRVALVSIHRLAALFRQRGWAMRWRDVPARLRCEGCGARGPHLAYSQRSVVVAGLSMAVHVPVGLDAIDWVLADERERKAMVRRTRG